MLKLQLTVILKYLNLIPMATKVTRVNLKARAISAWKVNLRISYFCLLHCYSNATRAICMLSECTLRISGESYRVTNVARWPSLYGPTTELARNVYVKLHVSAVGFVSSSAISICSTIYYILTTDLVTGQTIFLSLIFSWATNYYRPRLQDQECTAWCW